MASQEAIKQLGTNGGGFFNANSAHPFENPNAFANMLQIWSMLAVSAALLVMFGKMVGVERQGWALLAAVGVILLSRRRRRLCVRDRRQSAADRARPRSRAGQYGRQGDALRRRR